MRAQPRLHKSERTHLPKLVLLRQPARKRRHWQWLVRGHPHTRGRMPRLLPWTTLWHRRWPVRWPVRRRLPMRKIARRQRRRLLPFARPSPLHQRQRQRHRLLPWLSATALPDRVDRTILVHLLQWPAPRRQPQQQPARMIGPRPQYLTIREYQSLSLLAPIR